MPAPAQLLDDSRRQPVLDHQLTGEGHVRVEGTGEVSAVEHGSVDRFLQPQPEGGVGEEEIERPLVLLIAARSPEGQIRLALAESEAGAERGPGPLAGFQRVGMPRAQVELLGAAAETEAEVGEAGAGLQPAAARGAG